LKDIIDERSTVSLLRLWHNANPRIGLLGGRPWPQRKSYCLGDERARAHGVLLQLATEQWQIYRVWERKFHLGEVPLDTHPGNRGQSACYDEIEDCINEYLKSLSAPTHRLIAKFEAQEDQPELPRGCLRKWK